MLDKNKDKLYLELKTIISEKGYFKPAGLAYFFIGITLTIIALVGQISLFYIKSNILIFFIIWLLGQLSAQLGYLAHDAGHGAITKNKKLAWAIGHYGMSFYNGFSFSWWMYSHDNHHQYVNEPEEDLAMQYSVVISDHEEAIMRKEGLTRFIAKFQGYYIWLLLPFYHFGMVRDGIHYMLKYPKKCKWDIICFILFIFYWFLIPTYFIGFQMTMLYYIIIKMIGSIYLGLTFIVHHIGKKIINKNEYISYVQQNVEGTRTLNTWRIFDLYYAGLNYHKEHHLFENIPSWRYYSMRKIVKEFCQKNKIEYKEEGFWEAVKNVFLYLNQMGKLGDTSSTKGIIQ